MVPAHSTATSQRGALAAPPGARRRALRVGEVEKKDAYLMTQKGTPLLTSNGVTLSGGQRSSKEMEGQGEREAGVNVGQWAGGGFALI